MKDKENGSTVALVQRLNQKGITLIELLVVIAIIGIAVLAIAAPQIGRFRANYNLRSCATDLIQNMRVARSMAIKENREYLMVFQVPGTPNATVNPQGRYLIGFDFDGDNDLTTVSSGNNGDTFGICKDTNDDRVPDTDTDANSDSVPDCVKVITLNNCGNDIRFGYGTGDTKPPNGPPDSTSGGSIPDDGITFTGTPPRAEFNPDGSTDILGSAYFQHTGRGYSYCVRISTNAGAMNMWKWDGDNENATNKAKTGWTEMR